jgi:hypothetical protein
MQSLSQGESATMEAGVAHDCWNASDIVEAHVLIEIDQAGGADKFDFSRFEQLIGTMFSLTKDGKVDRQGGHSRCHCARVRRHHHFHATAACGSVCGAGHPRIHRQNAWL